MCNIKIQEVYQNQPSLWPQFSLGYYFTKLGAMLQSEEPLYTTVIHSVHAVEKDPVELPLPLFFIGGSLCFCAVFLDNY